MAQLNLYKKDEIKKKLGLEPNGKVQKYFTNTCYRYMDKYVPKDTGNLREIVTLTNDSITYEQGYAEEQYYGIVNGQPVVNYTTPGTGPYWDERMVSAEANDVVKEVQDYANKEAK